MKRLHCSSHFKWEFHHVFIFSGEPSMSSLKLSREIVGVHIELNSNRLYRDNELNYPTFRLRFFVFFMVPQASRFAHASALHTKKHTAEPNVRKIETNLFSLSLSIFCGVYTRRTLFISKIFSMFSRKKKTNKNILHSIFPRFRTQSLCTPTLNERVSMAKQEMKKV